MLGHRDEYTPAAVISHAILACNRRCCTGIAHGIVITPSPNPPNGGRADNDVTKRTEVRASEFLASRLQGTRRIPRLKALRTTTTRRR